TPDPCRGLAGYVTTYQGIAAAPDLHLAEFRRFRMLLVVDEVHHLPALPGAGQRKMLFEPNDESAAWSRALLPLLEAATIRLLLSGTLERADGRGILGLPYRRGARAATSDVDLDAPGWTVVGYSRAQALAEQAVLPVTFGALDGNASWLVPAVSNQVAVTGAVPEMSSWQQAGPHQLSGSYPRETTRPALFTALRTGFAEDLLRHAFEATREVRAQRRAARPAANGGADHSLRGLGKLLVVAPDQKQARRYLGVLRGWVPQRQASTVRLATSDERDAHEALAAEALAAFRLRAEPSILVTVAMAYEGLDAPEVAVVAALTHIRSRPWLEQMIARATRVDPNAASYEEQRALVFHPDDPLFATFRRRMETEQATLARKPKPARPQSDLPLWLRRELAAQDQVGIVPLESNALTLRLSTLRPGPELILRRREQEEVAGSVMEPPSAAERRLRQKVSEFVAAQAIEDEGEMQAGGGRHSLYHRYNAALKRVLGGKARAEMSLAELEAAVAWLERNRLRDHLHVLDGDARYAWTARRRAGDWRLPVGRDHRSTVL
ncbi:MAG: restriction endonuclease subunit R, partial [Acetobacteraceae bacterium]|nr:restriction endonuclease subunit R [Acetobacteraceae bacterium]